MADLTTEQQRIVDSPIDARLLVLAGAGTGKTHVLVERIRRLVEEDEVAPGRELLALSFTRAAVGELKKRIGLAPGRARLVQPITFDSFATRILAALTEDSVRRWDDLGYDGRITAAAQALGSDAGRELLDEYRHVFVDEIQDLVGVRATLVLTILDRVSGFTLLGDPAQAIYDHQIRDNADATSSSDFLSAVRQGHPGLVTVSLPVNFRTGNAEMSDVDRVGDHLRARDLDLPSVASALAETYRDLEPLSRFEDIAAAVRDTRQSTAILCRTNLDALRISAYLDQEGIEHRLQPEATDRVLPAWLATVFRGVERTRWSESRLTAHLEERVSMAGVPDAATVWRHLTNTVGDDEVVDLDVLRRRIAFGLLPDELAAPQPANIIVSTIHRAKGLEFDVVFTPPPSRHVEDEKNIEELRVLYVALTRARQATWTFPLPAAQPWSRDPTIGNRWVKSAWRERWKTLAIELRPDDLESRRPFGAGLVPSDPAQTQQYILDHVARGDPITFEFVDVREADEEVIPLYVAVHAGTPIGETGEALGRALARRLRTDRGASKWPESLTEATCDGIETVLGMATEGSVAGIGSSGLWLRPRVLGLASLGSTNESRVSA